LYYYYSKSNKTAIFIYLFLFILLWNRTQGTQYANLPANKLIQQGRLAGIRCSDDCDAESPLVTVGLRSISYYSLLLLCYTKKHHVKIVFFFTLFISLSRQKRINDTKHFQSHCNGFLSHCTLSLAVQCIVISPVCLRVCLWVCYHDNSKFACIDLHQTGSVGEGSDRLQLIKFWQSCTLGKGVCGRVEISGSALLHIYSQRAVFEHSERFFHWVVVFSQQPQVLWHCRRGRRKGIRLTVGGDLTAILPVVRVPAVITDIHIISCSRKIQDALTFRYQIVQLHNSQRMNTHPNMALVICRVTVTNCGQTRAAPFHQHGMMITWLAWWGWWRDGDKKISAGRVDNLFYHVTLCSGPNRFLWLAERPLIN